MDPSQMRYVILRWTSDGEKLSVEHLKCMEQPKKQYYNDYSAGEIVTAKFGRGDEKLYPAEISEVSRKCLLYILNYLFFLQW